GEIVDLHDPADAHVDFQEVVVGDHSGTVDCVFPLWNVRCYARDYSMPTFLMSALKRGSWRRESKLGAGMSVVSHSERSSYAACSQRSACSLSPSPMWTSAMAKAVLPGGRRSSAVRICCASARSPARPATYPKSPVIV